MKLGTSMAVVLALVLSACGDSKKTATEPRQPPTSGPPAATSPTATAAPAPPSTTGPSATTEPPAADGGEEPVRTPAVYTFEAGGRVSPATITVPAFIAVEITLVSRDGRAHELVLDAGQRYRLRVAAGGRSTVKVPGLRAGTYRLASAGGGPGATLVVGGEAGP